VVELRAARAGGDDAGGVRLEDVGIGFDGDGDGLLVKSGTDSGGGTLDLGATTGGRDLA